MQILSLEKQIPGIQKNFVHVSRNLQAHAQVVQQCCSPLLNRQKLTFTPFSAILDHFTALQIRNVEWPNFRRNMGAAIPPSYPFHHCMHLILWKAWYYYSFGWFRFVPCSSYVLTPSALTEVGLFRVPGSSSRVSALRSQINNGFNFIAIHLYLLTFPDPSSLDFASEEIPTVASLFKMIFREMSHPLFPFDEYMVLIVAAKTVHDLFLMVFFLISSEKCRGTEWDASRSDKSSSFSTKVYPQPDLSIFQ